METYLQKIKKSACTAYSRYYLNCKKYRMANHEANFPMAHSNLISIKYKIYFDHVFHSEAGYLHSFIEI